MKVYKLGKSSNRMGIFHDFSSKPFLNPRGSEVYMPVNARRNVQLPATLMIKTSGVQNDTK
jgi:hypothetical protein